MAGIGWKNTLRIAQVVETMNAGGAEGLAVDIANALVARGHESHLVVMDGKGPFRSRVHGSVQFQDLELPLRAGPYLSNAFYFRKTYAALSRSLKKYGVEVAQTHLPKSNFLGLFLGRNGVVRVHPTVHNNREFDYGNSSNRIKGFLRKRAYRQMLDWCGDMVAVSDQVAVAMAGELNIGGRLAERIVVIPNGVTIPPAVNPGKKKMIRRTWSVGEEEILLVAVGRLTRQKNFHSLVEALALVPEAAGPWKCVIAGEGELRGGLVADIKARGLDEKIILAGHVAEVGLLLAAADIFCLSSLYEGLPLVLLEAMAAGLPVCAYGIDGVTDVVKDGVHAKLAHPQDTADLAGAIQFFLTQPKSRQDMGAACRNRVQANYNFERVVDQLEELYKA